MNTTTPRYAVRTIQHPDLGRVWAVIIPEGRPNPMRAVYSADPRAGVPGAAYVFGRGAAAWPAAVDAIHRELDAHRPWKPFGATPSGTTTQTFTITDPDAVRAIAALFDDDEQQPAPATREEFVQAVADGVERALEARDERIRAAHHARIDAYVLRAMAEDDGIEELNAQGIYPPTGPEPARVIPGVDPRQRTATIHDRDCDEWTWDFAEGTWVQTATGTRSQWRGEAMLERGPFHAHRTA